MGRVARRSVRALSGPKFFDEELSWREEAFGEHPVLGPWGDPFHGPEADEVLECGLEDPEPCEACG